MTTIYQQPKSAAKGLHQLCNEARLGHPRHAGRTDNPHRRLGEWELHPDAKWCFIECESVDVATKAEGMLQEKFGYAGDTGGGNEKSVFVYAYNEWGPFL